MHSALSLAPFCLAAVLVLSGLAKLPDPASTHSMMSLLRLPGFLVKRPVAQALPIGELAVAALLLTPWRITFALGAVAAFLLFLSFWVIIARAMTFEPRPSCGCFGRVGDHRVNAKTVTRNTILLALSVLTAWVALEGQTGMSLVMDYAAGDWWWLIGAVLLATVAVLVLGGGPNGTLSRRERRRMERDAQRAQEEAATTGEEADADYVRTPIPQGILIDANNGTTTLPTLARQQAQLVVLANCWCGSTVDAISRIPGWSEQLPQLGVRLVHTLHPFEEPRVAELEGTLWDPGSQVYQALQAGASPAAVLLGADGLLAGGPVNGVDDIDQFVADIAEQLAQAPQVEADQPVG
ncbi:MauE/DoxX family redox-associated membrane protein [Ornithinimicrobium sp. Y1694]|uniref:MauE/DoxX family redox-associated membrane protein n=1 Tax=Ornithinimicrobium sp. Y1694 TaxID=3418590 RepID=UPI003CEF0B74